MILAKGTDHFQVNPARASILRGWRYSLQVAPRIARIALCVEVVFKNKQEVGRKAIIMAPQPQFVCRERKLYVLFAGIPDRIAVP